jgi:hypothetical protein
MPRYIELPLGWDYNSTRTIVRRQSRGYITAAVDMVSCQWAVRNHRDKTLHTGHARTMHLAVRDADRHIYLERCKEPELSHKFIA